MTVVQEHDYGCGVAAVAEVLGVSYAYALALFGPGADRKAATFGFYLHELTAALRRAGWRSYWLEVQPGSPHWSRMDAIVFLGKSPQYPAGHYLARRRGGPWSNSWSNFPRHPRAAALQRTLPAVPAFVIFNRRAA